MKDIWFISDTHFNHNNILAYEKEARPFSCVEEMNHILRDNWNSSVKPGDKVYHLGDVFFGDKEWFKSFWPTLNGSKRLVVGNHDDLKFLSSGGFFQKVMMWRIFSELGILCTHVPVHPSSFEGRFLKQPVINVHGHTHSKGSPEGYYKSVCVELTGLKPVHIDEVRTL